MLQQHDLTVAHNRQNLRHQHFAVVYTMEVLFVFHK